MGRKLSKSDLQWLRVLYNFPLRAAIKEVLARHAQGVDPRANTVSHYQTSVAVHGVLVQEGKLGPLALYNGNRRQQENLAALMKDMVRKQEIVTCRRLVMGEEWDVYQVPEQDQAPQVP